VVIPRLSLPPYDVAFWSKPSRGIPSFSAAYAGIRANANRSCFSLGITISTNYNLEALHRGNRELTIEPLSWSPGRSELSLLLRSFGHNWSDTSVFELCWSSITVASTIPDAQIGPVELSAISTTSYFPCVPLFRLPMRLLFPLPLGGRQCVVARSGAGPDRYLLWVSAIRLCAQGAFLYLYFLAGAHTQPSTLVQNPTPILFQSLEIFCISRVA